MMDDVRDRRGFCDKTKVIIQEQHCILTSGVKEVLSVTIAFYVSCSEEFQGISFFFYNYETQKLTKVFT